MGGASAWPMPVLRADAGRLTLQLADAAINDQFLDHDGKTHPVKYRVVEYRRTYFSAITALRRQLLAQVAPTTLAELPPVLRKIAAISSQWWFSPQFCYGCVDTSTGAICFYLYLFVFICHFFYLFTVFVTVNWSPFGLPCVTLKKLEPASMFQESVPASNSGTPRQYSTKPVSERCFGRHWAMHIRALQQSRTHRCVIEYRHAHLLTVELCVTS